MLSIRGFVLSSLLFYGTSLMPVEGQLLTRIPNTSLTLPAETPPDTPAPLVYGLTAATQLVFAQPMCTAYPPGETRRYYVAERGGKIWSVTDLSEPSQQRSLFMDLAVHLTAQNTPLQTDNENGLLSMAFHPDYHQNGFFFLYYSIRSGNQLHQRVARFKADGNGSYRSASSASAGSEAPLLTLRDQVGNHNGGDVAFGGDGYLYLSLGDEGGANDGYNNARFINKNFWGQVLRLDVDMRPQNLIPRPLNQSSTAHPSAVHTGTFKVPADNPFIGATTWHGRNIPSNNPAREEIYATGFRNPFRFSFDPPTGRLFLGDVGQGAREEVNIVVKGGDYGWSWREGNLAFNSSPSFPDSSPGNTNAPPTTGFNPIDPIISYPRNSGTGITIHGTSVCGGIVYRGSAMPEIVGHYLVGDIFSGVIAAYRETSPGVWTGTRLLTRGDCQIVDFGTHPSTGELLLCSLNDGRLYKISRSTGGYPESTLSNVGAFWDLSSLQPHLGLVRYEPNVSFWSNGSTKRRWFGIRSSTTAKMTYSEKGNWSFPAGTVWMKHFDMNTPEGLKKVETRFLVKTQTGAYGITYKWRADQSDADLVPAEGLTENIPGSSNTPWRYPSRSECMSCHTVAAGYGLSFHTAQLNRQFTMTNALQHQITALSQAGYLEGFNAASTAHLPALSTATDQSLEWRVRSYLAVNCAQCHQPGGGAQGTWDGRYSTPTALAGLIHGTLINQGTDPANRVVVPGDVGHSMLLQRIIGPTQGLAQMPPSPGIQTDSSAVSLLTAWINELATQPSFEQWQVQHFGSSSEPEAQALVDADGDGLTNESEYLLGTDPLDRSSRWAYQSMVMNAGKLKVGFVQPANRSARVEQSQDLENWSPLEMPNGTQGFPAAPTARQFELNLSEQRRFFRIHFAHP